MSHSQLNLSMGPLPVRDIELVSLDSLRAIPSKREAIRQCIWRSGLDQRVVAERLGIDHGHFSRIMSDKAHFPDDKYMDLYSVCGNYIPLQWEAMKCGFNLAIESVGAKKLREAKEEVARLEAEQQCLIG